MATTARDVDAAFAALNHAAQSAGLDTTGWGLDHGSVTYGRAFRLFVVEPGQTGHSTHPLTSSGGYVGSTRREAELVLRAMADTLRGLPRNV